MLRFRRGPNRVPQSEESLRLAEELAERLEAQERAIEQLRQAFAIDIY
jgi:hypothetical protein